MRVADAGNGRNHRRARARLARRGHLLLHNAGHCHLVRGFQRRLRRAQCKRCGCVDSNRQRRRRVHSDFDTAVHLDRAAAAQPLEMAAGGGLDGFDRVCGRVTDPAVHVRRAAPVFLGLLRSLQPLQLAADTVP